MPEAILNLLMQRRSANARNLMPPAPDAEALNRIVTAASRAPDHGRLVPFRFIEIAADARERLADLVGAAVREVSPGIDEAEIARARDKSLDGAAVLALIARIDDSHPKITASDQWLTVGCALENMLLAAQAAGFGVALKSGRYLEAKVLTQALGLAEGEHLGCFCVLGTASEWPPAKPKPSAESLLSTWRG